LPKLSDRFFFFFREFLPKAFHEGSLLKADFKVLPKAESRAIARHLSKKLFIA
jgi:hypothetical protein